MTFGSLIDSLGEKLGVEIEDAGGAFALEANYLYSRMQDRPASCRCDL